jgi:hypothetical protein
MLTHYNLAERPKLANLSSSLDLHNLDSQADPSTYLDTPDEPHKREQPSSLGAFATQQPLSLQQPADLTLVS